MIFKNWALKYHECGIPVIPLRGKIPQIKNWERWSLKEQTADEVEWLIARFPTANIGAVMGKWACAVDIDTDNNEVLQAVPFSPIKRKGNTGHITLYAPIDLQNNAGTRTPVELLNVGRQIVLPPSIHPDSGNPYKWTGLEDILTFNMCDLPKITESDITRIEKLCEKRGIFRAAKKERISHEGNVDMCFSDLGRNNKLSAMSYAMACDGVELDDGVFKLLSFDEREHEMPWFADKAEPHGGRDPEGAAKKMYTRAVAKAEKMGHVLPVGTFEFTPAATASPVVDDTYTQPPKARGLMKLFVDYCNETSSANQDALGLGGAITLMGGLLSNRYYTRTGAFNVWPNVMVINLAFSGFGKETSQRTIDNLLDHTTLLGSASYKSGTSIVMNLPEQQERIDLLDECSMLLKAMCSREDYKSEIVEILSLLYTKSDSRFMGFASRAEGARFGSCWNPCVNILGSTTPSGFRGSVSKEMSNKGLMPRFLVFNQQEIGEYKEFTSTERSDAILSELRRRVRLILAIDKRLHPEQDEKNLLADPKEKTTTRYAPIEVPMSDGAVRAWTEIARKYYDEGKDDPEGFESAFKNRFAQHIGKLALMDAVSLGLDEITVDQVEWAHSVVTWQWGTSRELYELASAENDYEKDVIKMLRFIKQHGTATKTQISRAFRKLYGNVRRDILQSLLDSGEIVRVEIPSRNGLGRPAKGFQFVKNIL